MTQVVIYQSYVWYKYDIYMVYLFLIINHSIIMVYIRYNKVYVIYIYMSNITLTWWLMLRQRAWTHPTHPTSDYIAWPCYDIHLFHRASLTSCRFGHMHVRYC